MNNNYHTQMDKQNNMLNEIAANNQLLHTDIARMDPRENPQLATERNSINMNLQQLQQQLNLQNLQNLQGTPINKGNSLPQQVPNPQLTPQQAYAQQLVQQQAHQNQLYQQQQQQQQLPAIGQYSNQSVQQQIPADNDEIELSEPKVEAKPRQNPEIKNESKVQQIQQVQNRVPLPLQEIYPPPRRIPRRSPTLNPNIPPEPVKKSNATTDYIIIPVLLIIVFVFLVHPKTSGFLEKYLPKMASMKGYLTRGLILALVYMVVKFLTATGNK